ncbi:MAG: YkgJ family cysteine cluster protein [Spirochaetaceae bacterium]|nr:YkgJ family cysteine cluster protein [Spirochaetaceae bacterium]
MDKPSDDVRDNFVKIVPRADESEFDRSVLGMNLKALARIYDDVAQKQQNFAAALKLRGLSVSCPRDCGLCCEHFMPDILPVEADMLAYHLLLRRPALIQLVFQDADKSARSDGCPFWNAEGRGRNCLVYEGRPLICRLFGCSTVHSKKGEPVFALCKQFPHNPQVPQRRYIGAQQIQDSFGAIPPAMSDYSAMILGIEPDGVSSRMPLDKALPPALNRVALMLQMTAKPA